MDQMFLKCLMFQLLGPDLKCGVAARLRPRALASGCQRCCSDTARSWCTSLLGSSCRLAGLSRSCFGGSMPREPTSPGILARPCPHKFQVFLRGREVAPGGRFAWGMRAMEAWRWHGGGGAWRGMAPLGRGFSKSVDACFCRATCKDWLSRCLRFFHGELLFFFSCCRMLPEAWPVSMQRRRQVSEVAPHVQPTLPVFSRPILCWRAWRQGLRLAGTLSF